MSKLPTRLRRNPILRDLVQETQLSINDLVQPILLLIVIKKLKSYQCQGNIIFL